MANSPFGLDTKLNFNEGALTGINTTVKQITSQNIITKGSGDSYGPSPSWVLCFATFENPDLHNPTAQDLSSGRDTSNKKWPSQNRPLATNNLIVVTSDCIDLKVTSTKSNFIHNMECTLLGGDINYIAAVNPGDYVTVNILGDDKSAASLAERAQNGLPVNSAVDGFKGLFKVTSVRKRLFTLPSGVKRIIFDIQGQAFTELNNSIYFNPYIVSSLGEGSLQYYLTNLSSSFQNMVGVPAQLQFIVKVLLNVILGSGPKLKNSNVDTTAQPPLKQTGSGLRKIDPVVVSPNAQFQVTSSVAGLINIPDAKSFNELYRFLFGVQTYTGNNYQPDLNDPKSSSSNFYETPYQVTGTTIIRPEYFNMSTGWSIINTYCNAPINEMYTTFRLSPEGIIMPFLVFRQIPFSSNGFADSTKHPTTPFTSLPQWIISPNLIIGESIGRDDAARFNFVQIFGKPFGWDSAGPDRNIATQISLGNNLIADRADIARSGLRPYVIQNSMDLAMTSSGGESSFMSGFWSKLLGDAVIGGQMKLNGQIKCFGITEPIAIGDNLVFDNTIYHIESIQHECGIDDAGNKRFFTTFGLSHGVDQASTSTKFNIYGESVNKSYDGSAAADNANNKIQPTIVNDSAQPVENDVGAAQDFNVDYFRK